VENNNSFFNPINVGLTESDYLKIISVFRQFPELEEVILYGSRAKGNYQPYSDIDIVLKGKDLNTSIQNKISLALDDLYLPYVFDVSILSTIDNQDLIDHVNRVGIVFYR
jgi:predicted nucleotidyltransferase